MERSGQYVTPFEFIGRLPLRQAIPLGDVYKRQNHTSCSCPSPSTYRNHGDCAASSKRMAA